MNKNIVQYDKNGKIGRLTFKYSLKDSPYLLKPVMAEELYNDDLLADKLSVKNDDDYDYFWHNIFDKVGYSEYITNAVFEKVWLSVILPALKLFDKSITFTQPKSFGYDIVFDISCDPYELMHNFYIDYIDADNDTIDIINWGLSEGNNRKRTSYKSLMRHIEDVENISAPDDPSYFEYTNAQLATGDYTTEEEALCIDIVKAVCSLIYNKELNNKYDQEVIEDSIISDFYANGWREGLKDNQIITENKSNRKGKLKRHKDIVQDIRDTMKTEHLPYMIYYIPDVHNLSDKEIENSINSLDNKKAKYLDIELSNLSPNDIVEYDMANINGENAIVVLVTKDFYNKFRMNR